MRIALLVLALTACAGSSHRLVYEEYTVGGARPEALLVALHYSSSTPGFWRELIADWGAPVRVVLPRGPRAHHRGGFTWFPASHEQKTPAEKTADVERVAAEVAAVIAEVRARHPEIRRVAVTGFSYGGDLAWMLAIRYPDQVTVAVPMGSRLLGEPTGRTAPVRVIQGDADAIIDVKQIAARVDALRARGVSVELQLYEGLGHDISPALISDWRTFLRDQLR